MNNPDPIEVFSKVQSIIEAHALEFDSVETLLVAPDAELVRGQRDWSRPFILVKGRRTDILKKQLPPTMDGVPVKVFAATTEEQALHFKNAVVSGKMDSEKQARAWRMEGAVEAAPYYKKLTYKPLVPSRLVGGSPRPMKIILHVSPDDGWPVLEKFLVPARSWKVAMYEFTAPHIITRIKEAVGEEGKLDLCLGPHESLGEGTKADDISELVTVQEFKDLWEDDGRFNFAWASVGMSLQWPRAYHIKVAVRDGKAFWLSSGNWQSSNQPNASLAFDETPSVETGRIMREHNRDWHVIIEDKALAGVYEEYIDKDIKTSQEDEAEGAVPEAGIPGALDPYYPDDAVFTPEFRIPFDLDDAVVEAARLPKRAFAHLTLPRDAGKPRSVQPILTPDNYAELVLPIMQKATTRLWFQNQSLSINKFPSESYRALLDCLKEKSWELEDCRIIFRDIMRPKTKDALKLLAQDGFNMDKVKVMSNCHTKGLLVDSRWTLLGSHNWTNEGTTYNRDASLLFDDAEVTAYFEGIVDHDWKHLAFALPVDLEAPAGIIRLPGEPEASLKELPIEELPARLDAKLS